MILLIVPQAFPYRGGIVAFNRAATKSIADLCLVSGSVTEVISLNDQRNPEEKDRYIDSDVTPFVGFRKRKCSFIWRTLTRSLSPQTSLLIFGHVNLAPLAVPIRCARPKLPMGVFVYGWGDAHRRQSLEKRIGLKCVDFAACISNYTAESLVQQNDFPADKIRLLPCCLDPFWEHTRNPNEVRLDMPDRFILTVARMESWERRKGVDALIEALLRVLCYQPDIHLVVVGSGSDVPRLKEMARIRSISDRVHFLGRVSNPELHFCYECCEVFALPSSQEGFGIVFLEAMSYRKPIVAARYGGTVDVVVDGETGILAEYGDVNGVAEALIRILEDRSLGEEMGERGYQRLKERFTFDAFKERFAAIIAEHNGFDCGLRRSADAR